MGVLRDRLGEREDRFFATVFFGSGILFLAMLFTASAIVGAILIAFSAEPQELVNSATFHFVRAAVYTILNAYMIKMAAVFMMTASTLTIYIGFPPRWLALLGYFLSLLLLFGSYYIRWSFCSSHSECFLSAFISLGTTHLGSEIRRAPLIN